MPDFRKATSSMPLLTKLTLALLVLLIAMCSVMLIGNATADRGFASGGNLTAADGGLMLTVVFALIAMSMLIRGHTRPQRPAATDRPERPQQPWSLTTTAVADDDRADRPWATDPR
ncbi:hypothetical protein ACWEQ4_06730 [Rhodococcus sp. NPDC003994]|uniref:hypothetical protein n=1 Tax=Rhodococcoides kroppenstedtii TaxID=293050 RepID=UPI00362D2740